MMTFQKLALGFLAILSVSVQAWADDIPANGLVIANPYFKTLYNIQYNIAYYSEYSLTAAHLKMPRVPRSNRFHADPYLTSKGMLAVPPAWYVNSGFDRGHLAPSGDFDWSAASDDATFTMSNMTPQRPNLNRIAWEALEEEVRKFACTEGEVEIVTGPILESGMSPFNGHPMPIPNRFFKAIVRLTPPRKAIAFVMSQTDANRTDWRGRVASLADVERLVNLHLYEETLPVMDPVREHANLNEWRETDCGPR